MKKTQVLYQFIVCSVFVAVLTACEQNAYEKMDGTVLSASVDRGGVAEPLLLRDTEGNYFRLESKRIVLGFKINRFLDSQILMNAPGHTAVFNVPQDILKANSTAFTLSSRDSDQPVDLRVEFRSVVLKQWASYRSDRQPVSSSPCALAGKSSSCRSASSQYVDYFYRDTYAEVRRLLSVEVEQEGRPVARVTAPIRTQQERLSAVVINSEEYARGVRETSQK